MKARMDRRGLVLAAAVGMVAISVTTIVIKVYHQKQDYLKFCRVII